MCAEAKCASRAAREAHRSTTTNRSGPSTTSCRSYCRQPSSARTSAATSAKAATCSPPLPGSACRTTTTRTGSVMTATLAGDRGRGSPRRPGAEGDIEAIDQAVERTVDVLRNAEPVRDLEDDEPVQ